MIQTSCSKGNQTGIPSSFTHCFLQRSFNGIRWRNWISPFFHCCSRRSHVPTQGKHCLKTGLNARNVANRAFSSKAAVASSFFLHSTSGLESITSEILQEDMTNFGVPMFHDVPLEVCLEFARPETRSARLVLYEIHYLVCSIKNERSFIKKRKLQSELLKNLNDQSSSLYIRGLQPQLAAKRCKKALERQTVYQRYGEPTDSPLEPTAHNQDTESRASNSETETLASIDEEAPLISEHNENLAEIVHVEGFEDQILFDGLDGAQVTNPNDYDRLSSAETSCPPVDDQTFDSMHCRHDEDEYTYEINSRVENEPDITHYYTLDGCPITASEKAAGMEQSNQSVILPQRHNSVTWKGPILEIPETSPDSCLNEQFREFALSSVTVLPRKPAPLDISRQNRNLFSWKTNESENSMDDAQLAPLWEGPRWSSFPVFKPNKSRDFFRRRQSYIRSYESVPTSKKDETSATQESSEDDNISSRITLSEVKYAKRQTSFHKALEHGALLTFETGNPKTFRVFKEEKHPILHLLATRSTKEDNCCSETKFLTCTTGITLSGAQEDSDELCFLSNQLPSTKSEGGCSAEVSSPKRFQGCFRRFTREGSDDIPSGSLTASVLRIFRRSKKFYHSATSIRNTLSAPGLNYYDRASYSGSIDSHNAFNSTSFSTSWVPSISGALTAFLGPSYSTQTSSPTSSTNRADSAYMNRGNPTTCASVNSATEETKQAALLSSFCPRRLPTLSAIHEMLSYRTNSISDDTPMPALFSKFEGITGCNTVKSYYKDIFQSKGTSRTPRGRVLEDLSTQGIRSSSTHEWNALTRRHEDDSLYNDPYESEVNIESKRNPLNLCLPLSPIPLRRRSLQFKENKSELQPRHTPRKITAKKLKIHHQSLEKHNGLHLHAIGHTRPSFSKEQLGSEGEDAFFVSCDGRLQAIGVADGVSEWTTFGVDGTKFPQIGVKNQAHQLLISAAKKVQSVGGSTVCIACLCPKGISLEFANLGDSSVAVFSPNTISGKISLFFKSPEQQHCTNVPYQLTRLPEQSELEALEQSGLEILASVSRRCYESEFVGDSALLHSATGRIPLVDGSLILIATDGFWDNLHMKDIEDLISAHFFEIKISRCYTRLKQLSKLLVDAAHQHSRRPPTRSFHQNQLSNGTRSSSKGGKNDDISLVVGWVTHSDSRNI